MEKLQVAGQKGVVKKKSKAGCVRYAECERNHAVKDGGSAVDGCKEFIASDENGGSALTCSCCGCHRNYHRIVEESDQESFDVREQKKRKTSEVWDHFTSTIDKYGNVRAICKHCNGQFDGSSKNGTTHLKKHLESMKCRAKRNGGDGNEDLSTQIRDLVTPPLVVMKEKSSVIDEDVSTQIRDLATLTPVVMKEKSSVIDEDVSTQIRDLATPTPVVMKEKPTVIDFIKQSFDEYGRRTEHWDPPLLNSRKDEILQVYQEEKGKLGEFLNKLSCRFTLDIYQVANNLILMVHYIDESWERQMKIIGMISKENYIQEMKKVCLDLKIERNICSIRQHDEHNDHDDEKIIESWFSQQASLPFAGVGYFEHASWENLFDKIQVYLIIVILDPRIKMDIVQSCNDADMYEKTLKYFRHIYHEYAKESSVYYEMMGASSTKSELDLYFHHLKVPAVKEFDILAWWRGNAPFFPTLSRMARDYLVLGDTELLIRLASN